MNVRQLIEMLQQLPSEAPVRIWDEEEDDFVEVQDALYEDGTSCVDLLPYEELRSEA